MAGVFPGKRIAPLLLLPGLLFSAFTLTGGGLPAGSSPPEKQTRDLSLRLQPAAVKSLAGRTGTVVVLEVDSGRLLAQHRLDLAARRLAAPGSTVKPFVLLTLLESGTLAPTTALVCGRALRLGGRRLDCTHPPTTKPLDPTSALAYSCNYYFAHFAARVRDSDLTPALERAGLTAPTGLAKNEAVGMARTPTTLEQRQLQALGEVNIVVTPLELLVAYRKLALRRKRAETPSPALATVFAGLEASTAYGMGRRAQPAGLRVAGKTGTAAAEGGWTHAWFAGYAPAQNPEIVLVVFLERGRGGQDAADVAREIFSAYQAAKGSP